MKISINFRRYNRNESKKQEEKQKKKSLLAEFSVVGDDCWSGRRLFWWRKLHLVVRHCGRRVVEDGRWKTSCGRRLFWWRKLHTVVRHCGRRAVEDELWKTSCGRRKVEDELWKSLEGAEEFGKRKGNFILNIFFITFLFFNFEYKFVPEYFDVEIEYKSLTAEIKCRKALTIYKWYVIYLCFRFTWIPWIIK